MDGAAFGISNNSEITARSCGRVKPPISDGGPEVERAKFSRNTLHSAGADTNLAGNFEDALPGPQLTLDSFFQR
jgi:hypothetical protein